MEVSHKYHLIYDHNIILFFAPIYGTSLSGLVLSELNPSGRRRRRHILLLLLWDIRSLKEVNGKILSLTADCNFHTFGHPLSPA
jgi:hypothetical protein